ncbi:MAG: threonylcarbamoyl-AMP synthase [Clostridia bacterium]|nr:threonylcarbamoyl-AMP synthase [Clostridia bacterium]
MKTQIVEINEKSLALAKNVIEGGGLVAFPTETVYGLGANAFCDDAVKQIYAVKGRPQDNPLIVHVHKDYDIERLVCDIPSYAKKLAEKFLPGPLTMVYKSRGAVSPTVSCGLDTLAVRIPSHEGAQRFLKYLDLPIAAPSANISKHVSPTSAEHVLADLNGKIPYILDGGASRGGIESTVLDVTGEKPCILRSGLITKEMIAEVAGSCDVFIPKEGVKVRSPGMKYKHYSPNCCTMLFPFDRIEQAKEAYLSETAKGVNAYIMCDSACAEVLGVKNILCLGKTEEEIAASLYGKLREGEQVAELIIAIAPEKQDGIMAGVMNRLTKACGGKQ